MSLDDHYNEYLDNIMLFFLLRSIPENFSLDQAYIGTQDYNHGDDGKPLISKSEIEKSLKRLASNETISHHENPFSSGYFSRNQNTAQKFQDQWNNKYSIVWKCANFSTFVRDTFIGMSEYKNKSGVKNNQKSEELFQKIEIEDNWSPLPLEYKGVNFEQSIKGIEDIIKEVAANNGYSAQHPLERDNIITALKAGLDTIKNGFITNPQLQTFVIQPLYQISKRFGDAALSESAKALIITIRTWTGL